MPKPVWKKEVKTNPFDWRPVFYGIVMAALVLEAILAIAF